MRYEVYIIKNLVNSKVYVGVTIRGYKLRFKEHMNSYKNGLTTKFSCAVNEIGAENFYVELLCTANESNWEEKEKYYIEKYKSTDDRYGYNTVQGGKFNPMDDKRVVEKHWEKTHTKEFLEARRLEGLNQPYSESRARKISERNKKDPDRYIAQLLKYNNSRKIKVAMLDTETEEVLQVFESLTAAVKYLGKPQTNSGILKTKLDAYNKNGKRQKMWGYYWSHVKEDVSTILNEE